jgi:hypothetical protein
MAKSSNYLRVFLFYSFFVKEPYPYANRFSTFANQMAFFIDICEDTYQQEMPFDTFTGILSFFAKVKQFFVSNSFF